MGLKPRDFQSRLRLSKHPVHHLLLFLKKQQGQTPQQELWSVVTDFGPEDKTQSPTKSSKKKQKQKDYMC
jgi:hypothetical protein